ncbi:MAG: hypothetical protein IPK26_00380 [Planctomycetes bacterium]|nr:hypothetical protein [Planctomycetota bacterium]
MSTRREYLRAGAAVAVSAQPIAGDHWRVRVGERTYEFRVAALGDGGVRYVPVGPDADAVGKADVAYGAPAGKGYMVRVAGRTFTLLSPAGRKGGGGGGADGTVRAPMTGTIMKMMCKAGDRVAADQTLVVLSAMKMEHKLAAGIAGVVKKVAASDGVTVEQGVELVVVEKETA